MTEVHTENEYETMQAAIDRITPEMFRRFKENGLYSKEPAFIAYKAALQKAVNESMEVKAFPSVWMIYNMGILVKSKATLFSIDLSHPDAVGLTQNLDFALITHNHSDHYTEQMYHAMDRDLHKTVVNNFADNYGAYRSDNSFGGGYTKTAKTFTFGDVKIMTSQTDHNSYLTDFTMTYEVHIGETVLYHTGDCSNVDKLNPTKTPDIWIVHPQCGMDVKDGYQKFQPKLTVIGHINEMGHSKDRWRWSWRDGIEAAHAIEELGGKAVVPLWGDRIC